MADIHLGFQKNETLQKIEQEVFEEALDECIRLKVDFILIAGDLFHVNIPEMRVQRYAFAKFRDVHEAGIPVYAVYGSHDFSPVSNSVIDLLAETGYITKATQAKESDGDKISLDFIVDEKTGAKIVGFPGLKAGKDAEYYEKLDRESLEAESGVKIFLFHGGIKEMMPDEDVGGDYMPLSLLPRGFKYYAGGHLHKYAHQKYDDYANIVYPGTPFAGYHSDLEDNAGGTRRGIVLVEIGEQTDVRLHDIKSAQCKMIEIDADAKNTEQVNKKISESIDEIDPSNSIVIIKVKGELSTGKTTDIDFARIQENLKKGNALEVKINRNQLSSREYNITAVSGSSKDEIESNIFSENIGEIISDQKELTGDSGIKLAKTLLRNLSQPQLENERGADYASRIMQETLGILGLDKDDS